MILFLIIVGVWITFCIFSVCAGEPAEFVFPLGVVFSFLLFLVFFIYSQIVSINTEQPFTKTVIEPKKEGEYYILDKNRFEPYIEKENELGQIKREYLSDIIFTQTTEPTRVDYTLEKKWYYWASPNGSKYLFPEDSQFKVE